MDELEKELKISFLEESGQLIEETEQAFLDLEHSPDDPALLDSIFRLAHNIKGTSRAVGFNDVADYTHHFESLLLKVKNGKIELTSEIITLLLKCNDHLSYVISELQSNLDAKIDSSDLISMLESTMANPPAKAEVTTSNAEADDGTSAYEDVEDGEFEESEALSLEDIKKIEISEPEELIADEPEQTSDVKVDVFAQSAFEEDMDDGDFDLEAIKKLESFDGDKMKSEISVENLNLEAATVDVAAKNDADGSAGGGSKGSDSGDSGRKSSPKKRAVDETLRVKLKEIEKLNNYVGELVILQTVLNQQKHKFESDLIQKTVGQLDKLSKEIQSISMGMRMIPIRQTFQKMQRAVRDISGALGKRVNMEVFGEDTEVDKTVVEKLADPLVHIIRNAVDHGLETPELRARTGKDIYGSLKFNAFHEGNNLVIEIEDDGAGLDLELIKDKALKKGIIKKDQSVTESEIINFIFHPGFSTKAEVSEISGRGVGMDVVRNNIEKLSGKIMLETVKDKGTKFKIVLPLTLAIIDGIITEVGGHKFVFPITQISETLQPKQNMITHVTGVGNMLTLRGQVMPIYKVGNKLNINEYIEDPSDGIVVIVNNYGNSFAVLVDEITRLQQVVIKKMGAEIKQKKGMIGSAILGDGMPSIILDLNEMFSGEANKNNRMTHMNAGVA